MTSRAGRLLDVVANICAFVSVSAFTLGLPSAGLLTTMLSGSVAVVCLLLFTSRTAAEFHSPVFLHPFVFLLLMLAGVFFFDSIYAHRMPSEVKTYIYVGFLSLYLGSICGQCLAAFFVRDSLVLACKPGSRGTLCLFAVMGFGAFAIMVTLKGVPILAQDIDEAKVNFYSGLGHFNAVYGFLPIVTMLLIADAARRGSKRGMQIAFVVLCLVLITNAATGFRSLVIKNLLSFTIFFGIMYGLKISRVTITASASVLIVIASIFGAFRRGNTGFEGAVNELGITVGARSRATELIFTNLEKARSIDFSYFGDLQKLTPGSGVGQNVDLKFAVFDNAYKMADIGGINPSIVGEALLAGGGSSVVLACFFLGLFTGTLHVLATKRAHYIFWPLVYAAIISELLGAIASGVATRMPGIMVEVLSVLLLSVLYRCKIRSSGSYDRAACA